MDESTIRITNNIIKSELSDNNNLLQMTRYRDIAFWWIADFEFAKKIEYFKKSEQNSQVTKNWSIREVFFKSYIYCDLLYSFFMKYLAISISSFQKNATISPNKGKILFISLDRWWNFIESKNKKGDTFFEPVLDKLRDRFELIGTWHIDIHPFSEIPTFIDKCLNWDIKYIPYNVFWSLEIWKKERDAVHYFQNQLELIQRDERFKKLCQENEINYYQVIQELQMYFSFLFPIGLKTIELFRSMLRKEKPDLLLIQSEYGWAERCLLIAAIEENIPTLAIQHGNISKTHRGYMYDGADISKDNKVCFPYCPIPNKFAVFGSYYCDLLINSSYFPENSMVVTGQPRYDFLSENTTKSPSGDIKNEYGIHQDEKVILWTTQSHSLSEEENLENIRTILSAIKQVNNACLVIKQHPNEPEKYQDLYKKTSEEFPFIKTIIPDKKCNTFQLISICDLMITKNSTTATEAVAMEKPIIILNVNGSEDPISYIEEGVAIGACNAEELSNVIVNILSNEIDLPKNREIFIKKYLNNLDGQASKQIAELAERMIAENNKATWNGENFNK